MENVTESECSERRANLQDKNDIQIAGVSKSQDIFRWLLSTFLVLYFVILGFSLQRIIGLESEVAKVEVKVEVIERFARYNFDKIDKMERHLKK
jgi:hypothetical protein